MNFVIFCLAAILVWFPLTAKEQPARPKITGIAHVRVYSTNLDNSRKFYGKIIALAPGTAGCAGLAQSCLAVNDHQQVEIIPAGTPATSNFLAEVAFTTNDVGEMRRYLIAHGITAGAISKDANGAQHFELLDPEGHPIAFVQQAARTVFKPSADQLSTRLFHAGFVVRDSGVEDRFYRDLLGFRMYWHGGFKESDTDWEEIQVPDGSDWIEYMLNISPTADKQERGVQNHFSFAVEKIQSAAVRLRSHGLKSTDEPEIGRDGKWSWDIYDPDLTRIEFMEFAPAQPPCCNPYTGPQPKP